MIKVIPIAVPISQRHVDEMGGDPRSPLAKEVFGKLEEILNARSEVRLILALAYTPPPEGHEGPWDTCHTAITGSELNPEVLRAAIDRLLPTLIRMRVMAEDSPEEIFVKEVKQ